MRIFGIDPGIAGAIAILDEKKIIDVIDLPTMSEGKKNKKQVNGRQIYNEITLIKNKFMVGDALGSALAKPVPSNLVSD